MYEKSKGNALYEFMKENRMKYLTNQVLFCVIFDRPLSYFWDNLTGFDIIKFDEDFIKPNVGESTNQAVSRKYGQTGCDIITKLI